MTQDIKVGDTVHVRGTAIGISEDKKRIWVDFVFGSTWVESKTVVHVEPRPLAVGDKVT